MSGSNTFGGTIRLEGEKEYRQAISQINSELKVFASEMGKVTAEYGKNNKGINSLSAQNKVLTEQIEKQKTKILTLKGALEQSSEKYGENDKKTNNWKVALNNAQAELTKLENELSDNKKALDESSSAIDKNSNSVKQFGDSVDNAGKKTLKLGDLIKANLISQAIIGGIKSLGNAIANVAKKFGDFVSSGIQNASDLAESQNVVDVTFKENAQTINEWSKKAANSYGLSELSAKKYNGTIGAMFKSMGIADDKVVDMSTSIVGLSADFASFYNLEHDEAFEKIRAGISGETEPLKQLGINMSVANLEAFALSQGIDKSYNSMTQAEQATLRYNYLMSVSADAQGDFARTSDSFANQQKIAKLNMENFATSIGSKLLPICNEALSIFNGMFSGTTDLSGGFSKLTYMIINLATDFLNTLPQFAKVGGETLTQLVSGITSMLPQIAPLATEIISSLVSSLTSNVSELTSAAVTIIVTLAQALINALPELTKAAIDIIVALIEGLAQAIPTLIPAIVEAVILIAQTLIDNIDILLQAAIDFFMALVQAIPEIIKVLVPKIPDIINSIVNALVENIPILLDGAIKLFMALVEAIPEIVVVLVENLPQIVTAIVDGLAQLQFLIWDILLDCIMKFFDFGQESKDAGEQGAKEFLNTVINYIKILPSKVWDSIVGAISSVVLWGNQMASKAYEAASNLVSNVINTLSGLPSRMWQIGQDLVSGIWNGISNTTDWILSKIRGFTDQIVSGIKSFFGIASPSKLMRDQIGKNLALGIGEGFNLEMQNINRQMRNAIFTDFKTNMDVKMPSISGIQAIKPDNINKDQGRVFNIHIENFINNRSQDVESFAKELEFYSRRSAFSQG